jgi:hypothetical protein
MTNESRKPMPGEEKRGVWEELHILRGVIFGTFVFVFGVAALLYGRFRIALLCLGLVAVNAWFIYRELRPAGYRLGDHRRARKSERNRRS